MTPHTFNDNELSSLRTGLERAIAHDAARELIHGTCFDDCHDRDAFNKAWWAMVEKLSEHGVQVEDRLDWRPRFACPLCRYAGSGFYHNGYSASGLYDHLGVGEQARACSVTAALRLVHEREFRARTAREHEERIAAQHAANRAAGLIKAAATRSAKKAAKLAASPSKNEAQP